MWKSYFKKHKKRKTRELLVQAVSFSKNKENALDLGAGTLIESKYLIKKGFKNVLAIDSAPETKLFARNFKNKKFSYKNIPFLEYDFPKNTFDLVNAQYALPFYGKKEFNSFIKNITKSLKSKGIFVGQFFGNKDSWKIDRKEIVFHTRKQAMSLLSDFKILEFIEEEKEGNTASGKPKHWHVFNFIVEKN